MTIQEMKKLIVGDVVQDLELYKNTGNVIYCVITKIYDDHMVYSKFYHFYLTIKLCKHK